MSVPSFKSGFAAFIGRPNAGKSTLLNALVGEHIAAVSSKPQTTRTRIQGIVTRPEGQIIFVDTPGIHKPGHALNRRMMKLVADALAQVDVVLLMRDATTSTGQGDRFTLDLIKQAAKTTFLLLNKIDVLKEKPALLSLIEYYRHEYNFAEVIPLSARTGDNRELLITKLLEYLPEGERLYDPEMFTDQIERNLAAGRGARIACIDDAGEYTYAELAERVNRAANALRTLGLQMEDRLLLCHLDTIDWPTVFLGAIKAGIVPVAVNTLLTPSDYEYMLNDSRARALVVQHGIVTVQERAGVDKVLNAETRGTPPPPGVCTVLVPDSVPPPGLLAIATVIVGRAPLVSVLPNWSCPATCTAGLITAPAAVVAGFTMNANWKSVLGVTVTVAVCVTKSAAFTVAEMALDSAVVELIVPVVTPRVLVGRAG